MKKLLFILLAMIWCIGANGQNDVEYYIDSTKTNFYGNYVKVPIKEQILNINTKENITLFDREFEVYRTDTTDNGEIIYHILLNWVYYYSDTKVFPLTLHGSEKYLRDFEQNQCYIDDSGERRYKITNDIYLFVINDEIYYCGLNDTPEIYK